MNFNIEGILKNAWAEVEKYYMLTLLPYESPCNFCLCKSIWEQLPEGIHLSFDHRISDDGQDKQSPDLTIWVNDDSPEVLFVGELKFEPHKLIEKQKVIGDLEKLSSYLRRDYFETLTLDPFTGKFNDRKVRVTDNTQAGFFLTTRHDSVFADKDYLVQLFGSELAGRLHLGVGTVYGIKDRRPKFEYIKPTK